MTWNPQQYLKFAGERLRPALDLMARIDVPAPRTIVDLGCGPGNVTALLAERWPQAQVVGIDNSEAMLAKARASAPGNVEYVAGDLAAWTPGATVDLVYTNAALHWLPDHASLFPRLMAALAPGAVLAVQMPSNFREPSHSRLSIGRPNPSDETGTNSTSPFRLLISASRRPTSNASTSGACFLDVSGFGRPNRSQRSVDRRTLVSAHLASCRKSPSEQERGERGGADGHERRAGHAERGERAALIGVELVTRGFFFFFAATRAPAKQPSMIRRRTRVRCRTCSFRRASRDSKSGSTPDLPTARRPGQTVRRPACCPGPAFGPWRAPPYGPPWHAVRPAAPCG